MKTQSNSKDTGAPTTPRSANSDANYDLNTLKAAAQVIASAETWEDVKDWLALQLNMIENKSNTPDGHAHCFPIPESHIGNAGKTTIKFDPASAEMTEEDMRTRIAMLSAEMDANDEENRLYQEEINILYAKIDAAKIH